MSNLGFVLLVGLGRVELPTSPLSGVRSNQLSYRPVSMQRVIGRPDRFSHLCRSNSIVTEPAGSLKTEQDEQTDSRYCDSYRPRDASLRDPVLIRGVR